MAFTFFFRDSETLELAIEETLPSLQGRAFIHVWDAGCAHGPEPYTLAILLRRRMSDFMFRNVRIHATDVDPQFGAKVAAGVFPESELRRIPGLLFQRYFRATDQEGWFQVIDEVRSRIEFTRHDLLSLLPARPELSLIVCKNVLLHFDEVQRINVLQMFYQALQPGGTLVMERTQKMPATLATCFRQVAPYAQVFHKLDRAVGGPRAEGIVSHLHSEGLAGIHGPRPLPHCGKSHRV